jgi:predicted short-subunit dehydrogenase-like oxidoreductase (DUF2520 family)
MHAQFKNLLVELLKNPNKRNMKSLNLIGAGKLGKVLGRLFYEHQVLHIQQIFCRHQEHAQQAVAFIGDGRTQALSDWPLLLAADIYCLAVPDDVIVIVAERLAQTGLIQPDTIIFHCSGSKSSEILRALSACGASVASVHPVKSFANPDKLILEFVGTLCGIEGDPYAVEQLSLVFERIGARMLPIASNNKLTYHAGSVFASNYLVSLMELAIQTYQHAGIPKEMAYELAQALATATLQNVFELGTQAALTGPIQRGDMVTVQGQLAQLHNTDEQLAQMYQAFIAPTMQLAKLEK